jgi:replication factor A1
MQGTLQPSLTPLVENNTIELNSIIRLTKYSTNTIKNHRLLMIGEIGTEDVVKNVTGRIGTPANIDTDTGIAAVNESAPQPLQSAPVAQSAPVSAHAPVQPAQMLAQPQQKPHQPHQQQQQSKPQLPGNIQPISTLTPYKDRNEIRARVTVKSDIKKWTNERGEGRLFSVTLLDHSGEIRLTCFNEVADKYFDLLQEGKVYDVSNFQVKISKRQYGNVQNDYEISADSHTAIAPVLDAVNDDIPSIHYTFVKIAKVAESKKDDVLDVIGVVKECGELQQITAKTTQKQLTKRDITLLDTSNASIRVTFWGKLAEDFTEAQAASCPVLAIKGARVNEYQGKMLSVSGSSQLSVNPDLPESHELRGWFDANAAQISSANVTNVSVAARLDAYQREDDRKFLSQIKDENLGFSEKPDYFSVIASVSYIRAENATISYMACPTEGCNKKVIEEGPNQFRCERCQKVFDRCDHRYVMTLQISDSTGAAWVQAFNDSGVQILSKTAEEMYYLKMQVNEQNYARNSTQLN